MMFIREIFAATGSTFFYLLLSVFSHQGFLRIACLFTTPKECQRCVPSSYEPSALAARFNFGSKNNEHLVAFLSCCLRSRPSASFYFRVNRACHIRCVSFVEHRYFRNLDTVRRKCTVEEKTGLVGGKFFCTSQVRNEWLSFEDFHGAIKK